jgi:hypothetical protein
MGVRSPGGFAMLDPKTVRRRYPDSVTAQRNPGVKLDVDAEG